MKTANLRRKHGISDVTFYNKKAECSGLEQSEAKRLRGREERERQAEETVRGSPRDGSYFMDSARLAQSRPIPKEKGRNRSKPFISLFR